MRTVTLIPGDGIGPEIADSVVKIFQAAEVPIEWQRINAGLEAYKSSGSLIPKDLIESIKTTRCALKGPTTTPVGTGHRSVNVYMRQYFELYANVRPVRSIPGVSCVHDDLDIIIVRENSEDLYKGIEYKVNDRVAHGIKLITADASERIGRFAFQLARDLDRKKVTAVHKANIMKLTDGLFLESIRKVSAEFPDIEFAECIVDNACMQLVTKPHQFDVIVTENLYGDIISDLGSGLIGGLGVASGANIGDDRAIFEAVHGSAPDIAGRDLANPTALIFSGLSMLDYLDMKPFAERIREAMMTTLGNQDTRTKDLGGPMSTSAFTEAVIGNL